MAEVESKRSLTKYPSVVVAHFMTRAAVDAALEELRGLSLGVNDASVINAVAKVAAAPPPAPGFFRRLGASVRGALGQAPPAAGSAKPLVIPSMGLVVIFQTTRVPAETIVEVCQRHGAGQVDMRAAMDVATSGMSDRR